jgi:hypothetical protein
MRATFFIMGGSIFAERDLGVIDLYQIAQALAMILGVNCR